MDIPDPSAEDSDGGYDASISSCSQPSDDIVLDDTTTESVSYDGTYVIPMRRRPGQPGVKPRSATTITSSESSAESSQIRRPQRVRRKPPWMKSSEWVFAQPYTSTVDRKNVAFL